MYPIYSENEYVTVTEQYFTMPDGINLYTRIMVPKGFSKAPIVFIRTPYEPAHNGVTYDITKCKDNLFIQNGYAVVLQHVRGRGDSEGICLPYAEREDGLHTLEIIRQLDIYNGSIYIWGGSYLSTVHLSYLDTNPADIKGAVLNIQTDRMYFRNYRNGCCYSFCNLHWWLSMINRVHPNPNLEEAYKRPYKDIMRRVIGTEYPPYTNLLLNDENNDFWQSDPRTRAIDQLKIPVLFTEGWYDFYLEGMFSMWERLPENTKKKSAMFVGPWGHDTAVSEQAEYPLPKGNLPADFAVAWFNSIRDEKPYPYAATGQVNYYTIGSAVWNASPYPLAPFKKMRLYFGSQHTLQPAPCETEQSISYIYDPEKRLDCYKYQNIYQAADMGSVEGVTSFLSQPFPQDKSFLGKIRWKMDVCSDCDDTAFFIRVYFVENGKAYNLTETITSLSHIKKDYQAGEQITIDLYTPPIAFTVKKGSQIRVDISSDGGVYVPHANKKEHWATVTETKIATNTICLDDSFIELPCNS